MKKQMNYLLLFVGLFCSTALWAQTQTVTGTVTDDSGEPAIGATVRVTGTSVGSITDFNGNFTLEAPQGAETLTISGIGYAQKVVPISSVVNVVLSTDTNELEGIVVTALGIEREKEALGYAISEVSSETITEANPTGFLESLKSNVAGVQVNTASGAAGSGTRVVIRGQTSLNGGNQALMIVDGIRINNSTLASESTTGGVAYSNRAIDINPADIESITVLKGAAAAALYGSVASNGAILITTKKGSKGKPVISFTNTFTTGQYSDMVSLQNKFAQGSGGVYQGPETGQSGSWGPAMSSLYYDGDASYQWDPRGRLVSDPNAGPQAVVANNVDNYFKSSFSTNNGVSIAGGSESITYRFSVDHLNEDGYVPNNDFKRTNVTLGSEAKFNDNKLRLTNSFSFINSGGSRIQQGSNLSGVMLGLLRTPVSFDNSLGYQFADGSQRSYRGGGGYDNPFWVSNNTPFNDDVNRLLGSVSAAYDITDWLTTTLRVGLDNYSDFRTQSFEIGSRAFPTGRVFTDNYTYRSIDSYLNLGGNVDLTKDAKLDMNYNVGVNLFGTKLDNAYTQGDGLNFVGFPSINNTANISQTNSLVRERTMSGYGSLEFGYDNFAYLTVTGRQDYLSNLVVPGADYKLKDVGVFYPSASLSFIASEKMDVDNMDLLKFRLSYAQTGTGAPAAYATSTIFSAAQPLDGWTNGVNFPFNGVSGFSLDDVLGSPDLTPALTDEIEVGIETSWFNNRVNLDAAYYTRQDNDQIVDVPISDASGFSNLFLNSGSLETKGWDIVLGATPIETENFSWTITNAFTTWNTVVTELADGVEQQFLGGFTGSSINNVVGFEYGQIFGNPYLRNNQGQLVIDDDPSSSTFGFPKEDPVQQAIGNPNPDFILGITNRFKHKNFDLSFLIDIREGGDVWNGTKGALTFFGMSEFTENRGEIRVFDGVKESTGQPNDIAVQLGQSWYQGNGGGFGTVAEPFIEDGSWVRLRNVKLGYTVSQSTWKKSPFSELNFNLIGNNLLLITDYDGDPEASLLGAGSNGQGLNYFELPNRKTMALGVNFKF